MQQQLDLRDRQLIEANRAKADLLVPSFCSTYLDIMWHQHSYCVKRFIYIILFINLTWQLILCPKIFPFWDIDSCTLYWYMSYGAKNRKCLHYRRLWCLTAVERYLLSVTIFMRLCDVYWFISEERRRQQQLQAQVEQQNKMELQRQEQQILQSEELLRNQMVCVPPLLLFTAVSQTWC